MDPVENRRAFAEKLADSEYMLLGCRDYDNGNEYFIAYNPELPGCMADGETQQEAYERLREVRVDVIEVLLQRNIPVPSPMTAVGYVTGVPEIGTSLGTVVPSLQIPITVSVAGDVPTGCAAYSPYVDRLVAAQTFA